MSGFYSPPVTRVEVELTEACNLRCRFCYHSCAPRESHAAEDILARLARDGVMEVILTGGEPALHSRFAAVLDVACGLFPRVMVQSNGTLFANQAAFAPLGTRRIFCLNFSLHGPREVHEALTGVPGSFDAACAALTLAAEAGIRTASNLVLTAENADPTLLHHAVAHLARCGCREMTVTRFIPAGLGRHEPLTPDRGTFVAALRTLVAATAAHGMDFLLANAAPPCRLPEDLQHLSNRCSFGFDKFYVDVQGELLTCGMARTPLGNILARPLAEVLHSAPLYQRYLAHEHVPRRCRDCSRLADCGGGCRAAALAQSGVIDGEDRLCDAANGICIN